MEMDLLLFDLFRHWMNHMVQTDRGLEALTVQQLTVL